MSDGVPELAIQTPQETTDLGQLGDLWQAADDLGYAAAFTFDHLVPLHPGERPGSRHTGDRNGDQLDGWLTAAVLAARTRSLQVGTLVSGVTYRPAVVLAKLAVTLDHATGGRAILGVGAGWHRAEHDMFGPPFPPAAERLRLLEETVVAFGLLCQESVTTFRGHYVDLQEAVFSPKPVRPDGIPVLVGGSSSRVLDIAGRWADVYNGFAAPSEWAGVHSQLDRAATAADRRPGDVRRTAFVRADLSGDPVAAAALVEQVAVTRDEPTDLAASRVLTGSRDELAAGLRRFGAVGIDQVVVSVGPVRHAGVARPAGHRPTGGDRDGWRMSTVLITGGAVLTCHSGSHGAPVVLSARRADLLVADGRIVELPTTEQTADEVVDATGMLVIPGLVQGHVHLCQTLMRGMADDRDVVEWLRTAIWPAEQAHDAGSLRASAELGIAELLLSGTTTALTMETAHGTEVVLDAVDRLGLRAVVGPALMDLQEPARRWSRRPPTRRSRR